MTSQAPIAKLFAAHLLRVDHVLRQKDAWRSRARVNNSYLRGGVTHAASGGKRLLPIPRNGRFGLFSSDFQCADRWSSMSSCRLRHKRHRDFRPLDRVINAPRAFFFAKIGVGSSSCCGLNSESWSTQPTIATA
jgi:hypothetical protein